jgi:hypothetical protein
MAQSYPSHVEFYTRLAEVDTSSDAAIARALSDASAGARVCAPLLSPSSLIVTPVPSLLSQNTPSPLSTPLTNWLHASGVPPPPDTSLDAALALQLHSDEVDRLCEPRAPLARMPGAVVLVPQINRR